jgi:hypothetical protein
MGTTRQNPTVNHEVEQGDMRMSVRRLLIGICATIALSLTVTVGSASAVTQRSLVGTFGPDGTKTSFFQDEQKLGFDQADNWLYVMPMWPAGPGTGAEGIYRFDTATPGTYTPTGAPYPIPVPGSGYIGGFTVDNSATSTHGRLYQATGGALTAWESDGTQVGTPYPISPGEGGRFCESVVAPNGVVFAANYNGNVERFSNLGVPLEEVDVLKYQESPPCAMALDSHNNLFVDSRDKGIWKFTASSSYTEGIPWIQGGGNAAQIVVDKTDDHLFVNWGTFVKEYDDQGNVLLEFGETYGVQNGAFDGVAVNEATNEFYAADNGGRQVRVFGPPKLLPKLTTERPKDVLTTGAKVFGHVDLDGGPEITECLFQYGTDKSYGTGEIPCQEIGGPGAPYTGPADVTADITGLAQATEYHYRLVAKTSEGVGVGQDQTLITADPPEITGERVIEVTADHALLEAFSNPRGVKSNWKVEYGPEDCAVSTCESTTETELIECNALLGSCPPAPTGPKLISKEITNLTPGVEYHFRFVGLNNQAGVGYGADDVFKTFPLDPSGTDPCPNAQTRKLTGASKLPHCRSYELVSASDAAGYDVASNIVDGEAPLDAYPQANDRFLYTTSAGKLPGIAGFPVNLGTDPYVATRGPQGWTTEYDGLPATLPSQNPFLSTVSGADAGLKTFAFGASGGCSPCFGDGSTGIPLRLPDGSIEQGMQGSIPVAKPKSLGVVAKPVSADGSHFVFGSNQKFEPNGNPSSPTIYDRDLAAGTTQVASTMPDGSTMTGEVAELAISADGSRILIGKPTGTDAEGATLYDLYMHVGTDPKSVPVAVGDAVQFDGMTEDGTKVYFTSTATLADDADASPDIFRADVGSSSATVERVSRGTGGAGNVDSCTPPEDWNVAEGGPNCGALAFAGGGGVASGDGTFYFISPEQLDGTANTSIKDQPNLYVTRPGWSAPKYVGLLDNSLTKPPPEPPRHPVVTKTFGGSHNQVGAIAVDLETEDVYVSEAGRIARFTAQGGPDLFTAGPGLNTNKIGVGTGGPSEATIAVDNAPGSPFRGDFYTRDGTQQINVYARTGAYLGAISGFGEACGLAIDQKTGDVYVGDFGYPGIRKFHPLNSTGPVANSNYTETSIRTAGLNPCQVDVDSAGHAYASRWSQGPLRVYDTSEFAAGGPEVIGTQVTSFAKGLYADGVSDELYVEEGPAITIYPPGGGTPLGTAGVGTLTNESFAVAVNGNSHHVYASNGSAIIEYGFEEVPYLEIDDPAVLHAKRQAEKRDTSDIQITPSGDDGIFTSTIQLTSQPTDGNAMVFRYNAPSEALNCVSCTPTRALTTGNAFLAPNGTNIDDGGRVYFNSPDQLTLRDTNRRTDAYEWDNGTVNLISTGTGVVNAALASVESSGKNAYFFTRESIAPQDDNGATMKVYTAREGGGYTILPPTVPCQAADECRGPGTQVAPPPAIGTYKGTGGNVGAKQSCKKGHVRRHRRCVKKKSPKLKRRHRGTHRG